MEYKTTYLIKYKIHIVNLVLDENGPESAAIDAMVGPELNTYVHELISDPTEWAKFKKFAGDTWFRLTKGVIK